ncbi:MAG: adenylate/guanylate cyclase domain-containing protein [bacterium]
MSRLRRHLPLVGGILATLTVSSLFALQATGVWRWPLLDRVEAWSLDARFKVRGPRKPRDDRIVIIGVDDKVRAEFPKLNQERRVWARFLDRVAAARPRAVGVDYIFDTPEQRLPRRLEERLRTEQRALAALGGGKLDPAARRVVQSTAALLDALLELNRGDERLSAALRRAGNVAPGVLFHFSGTGYDGALTGRLQRAAYAEAVVPRGLPARRLPPQAVGASGVTPTLERSIAAAGFVNNIVEDDGATRRYYTAIRFRGQVYVPLSVQLLRMSLGISRADLGYVGGARELKLGPHRVPLDSRGRLLIDFLGPKGTFRTISAADVLAGRVDPSVLRDKIVLIGPNDSANIDKAITPFDPLLPGVELHATVIHNLAHGEALRQVSWLWTLLSVLLLGLLATLLHALPFHRRWLWIGVGTVLVVAAYLALAQWLFTRSGLWLAVVYPVGSLLLVTGVALVLGFLTEGLEKRRIRSLFQHYLHADVIRELTLDPEKLKLGGERREVTVLFSDIRGFSSLSEQLDPQALALLVNQYLTPMTDAVLDEKGYLDKYIGDAIMALFGAPRPRDDHAELAARTALTMLARLERLNRKWKGEPWAPVQIGIGMNSGEVSLGNFGSERRIEYTAIGDTVNLASRLEGLNKAYGTTILVGETVAEGLHEKFWLREVDLVRVMGKEHATRIFELLGPRDQKCPVPVERFAQGLAAYREADWSAARDHFQAVLDAHPADGPAQVFLDRLSKLERDAPKQWDGVFVMDSK